MSKILSEDETKKIVEQLLKPLGFSVLVTRYDYKAHSYERCQLCNTITTTKTKGILWWKKKVTTTTYESAFEGPNWETALKKLVDWIDSSVKPRIVLAEQLRDRYAQLENAEALDKELRKDA